MINRAVVCGRLVRDPELRRTQNGTPVTSFTLAVNRTFKNADGQQEADFLNCVAWNKTAEIVDQYCSKGNLVGVEGRLQSRRYQDNQGNNRTVVEIIADQVQFMQSKDSGNHPAETMAQASEKYYGRNRVANSIYPDQMSSAGFDLNDDDIEF